MDLGAVPVGYEAQFTVPSVLFPDESTSEIITVLEVLVIVVVMLLNEGATERGAKIAVSMR